MPVVIESTTNDYANAGLKFSNKSPYWSERLLNAMLWLKRSAPQLWRFLRYAVPITLLITTPFAWAVLPILITLSPAVVLITQISLTLFSLIGLMTCFKINQLNSLIGAKVAPFENLYKNELEKEYKGSSAKLTPSQNKTMPKLCIKANTHQDAGFLEGYLLAKPMAKILRKLKAHIPAEAELKKHMPEIINLLPKEYAEEMQGKVDGYNEWLKQQPNNQKIIFKFLCWTGWRPRYPNLTLDEYAYLQLLPDLDNYNPFMTQTETNSLNDKPGCTTVAFKIGEYTCYLRVVDWLPFKIAGRSFIQIEREIAGTGKTCDINLPIFSGCLTVLNEKHLLTQLNVARNKKTKLKENKPNGMPATFYVRRLAEDAKSISDMKILMKNDNVNCLKSGPLSGVHICATDGVDTIALHAKQSANAGHVLEEMTETPLVVTNLCFDQETGSNRELAPGGSSIERMENAYYFFKKYPKDAVLQDKNTEETRLEAMRNYLAMIMKLPLINNFGSICGAIFIYKNHDLVDCRLSTDNGFCGDRNVDEMYTLAV